MTRNSYSSDLSIDEKVLMAIVKVAEMLRRNYNGVFKDYGVSFPQYSLLRALAANQGGQVKIVDVSLKMMVPAANLTRILKRLESDGFIIKKEDPGDERVTLLEISSKGRRTLKYIENEKNSELKRLLADLSMSEKIELIKKTKHILRNGLSIRNCPN